jgi:hypothetical protein
MVAGRRLAAAANRAVMAASLARERERERVKEKRGGRKGCATV